MRREANFGVLQKDSCRFPSTGCFVAYLGVGGRECVAENDNAAAPVQFAAVTAEFARARLREGRSTSRLVHRLVLRARGKRRALRGFIALFAITAAAAAVGSTCQQRMKQGGGGEGPTNEI